MNQWIFVFAAYGVATVLTGGLVIWSFVSMRRAEAAVEAIVRK